MLLHSLAVFALLAFVGLASHLKTGTLNRQKWLLGNHGHFSAAIKPNIRSKKVSKAVKNYYEQRIDHFSNNSQTFFQRYWYSDYYYKPGSPVFLMIEGESEADPFWIEYEDIPFYKMTRDHNGFAFVLEHRYYGQSQPFNDLSVESLKYLSSRQALEDVAKFVEAMTNKFNLQGAKWFTFGGSYSGALSAWMRLKYPDLIYGAVATSGPIFAEVDFTEYMEVVETALTEQSRKCADNVKLGFQKVQELMKTTSGRAQLQRVFNLCDSLETASEDDKATFYEAILGNYMYVVQYSGDNAGYFRNDLTVEKICSMHQVDTVDPIDQLGNVNSYLMPYFGEECVGFSYQEQIELLRDTSTQSEYADTRAWMWQTCTEFGYYQTTNSKTAGQFFGSLVNLRYFTAQCEQIYGSEYSEASIYASANATNYFYGGKAFKGSRVVFPNGSWDPWHKLGIVKSKYPAYVGIYMKGTSHCADMYEPLADDLESLKLGRETIELYVASWANMY